MVLTVFIVVMLIVFKWSLMALVLTHNEEKRLKSLYNIL